MKNSKLYNTTAAFINKMKYPPQASGVIMIKRMNKLFTTAAVYQKRHNIKRSCWYDHTVADEASKMTKKRSIQMKDLTFNDKDAGLIIGLTQYFRAPYHASNIQEK